MFLGRLVGAGALALVAASLPGPADADVIVRIDKSAQRMSVSVDGQERHVWSVSTGRAGFGTPNGRFRAQWLARSWFSRKYYNSPMPHSIFFHEGFAIHGTNYISRLGGPASHGCVRLHPANAAALFALVKEHGTSNTQIVVTGQNATHIARRATPPRARGMARSRSLDGLAARAQIPYRASRSYRAPAYHDVTSGAPVYYRVPAYGSRWQYGNAYWY